MGVEITSAQDPLIRRERHQFIALRVCHESLAGGQPVWH
jgi:hypothetical protein